MPRTSQRMDCLSNTVSNRCGTITETHLSFINQNFPTMYQIIRFGLKVVKTVIWRTKSPTMLSYTPESRWPSQLCFTMLRAYNAFGDQTIEILHLTILWIAVSHILLCIGWGTAVISEGDSSLNLIASLCCPMSFMSS